MPTRGQGAGHVPMYYVCMYILYFVLRTYIICMHACIGSTYADRRDGECKICWYRYIYMDPELGDVCRIF